MPGKKPPRKRMGYFDAQDRVFKLGSIYRSSLFNRERTDAMTKSTHAELDDVATPEPDEELEDSELGDSERQQAIARERMRREGRG
jgi:hypothetical protein